MDSVVDCDAENNRGREGGYFVLLVQTGLREGPEEWGDEDDEEEENEEGWCESRQTFQAWDLVKIYASILYGDWPDGYGERDETGRIEIVNL